MRISDIFLLAIVIELAFVWYSNFTPDTIAMLTTVFACVNVVLVLVILEVRTRSVG